jgi:hypothetical protein
VAEVPDAHDLGGDPMQADPTPAPGSSAVNAPSHFRELAADALRYWELRRLAYNLLLAAIVVWHFVAGWPESRIALESSRILILFVLAILANVAYSVVYLPDMFIQYAGFRQWRSYWRWIFVLAGFGLAAVLTHLFAGGLTGHDAD